MGVSQDYGYHFWCPFVADEKHVSTLGSPYLRKRPCEITELGTLSNQETIKCKTLTRIQGHGKSFCLFLCLSFGLHAIFCVLLRMLHQMSHENTKEQTEQKKYAQAVFLLLQALPFVMREISEH